MADGIVRTGSHTNQMNHIKIKQNLHGKNSSGAQPNGTESLFICAHPVTPNMVNFRERVRTFIKWPKTITKATAVQIAKAGFFFLGDRDRTKCFYCNGGLQNWEYNDEPWSEHAKWFPNCEFVLQQKGIQFVQEITTKFPNLKRPNMAGQQILPNVCPPTHSHTQQLNKVQTLSQVLESDVVKMATSFGFDDELVRQVIEQTLHEERRLPDSVMELVTAFQEEEKRLKLNKKEMEFNDSGNPEASLAPEGSSKPSSSSLSSSSSETHSKNTNEVQNLQSSPIPASGCKLVEKQIPGSKKITFAKEKPEDSNTQQNQATGSVTFADQQEQLRNLKNELRCKICLDLPMNCMLLDCGHICCCTDCAPGLRDCPICRRKIIKIVKIYRK